MQEKLFWFFMSQESMSIKRFRVQNNMVSKWWEKTFSPEFTCTMKVELKRHQNVGSFSSK
eukprot:snap_masked-scaffold_6-processed-gene-11.20-mRNA-1 protein AED:1.00 eAED:1.00 QI:0/-1/0/0/-1/1/1/0/59